MNREHFLRRAAEIDKYVAEQMAAGRSAESLGREFGVTAARIYQRQARFKARHTE